MKNIYLKKKSASFAIGEMQTKTTMRYHLTPVKMTIIKKISARQDVEKRETLHTVGRNIN